ncbi:MAG: carboxylating nicotinate-nucleotide diphosphorylase [Candidatus Methanomethylicia archaeon]
MFRSMIDLFMSWIREDAPFGDLTSEFLISRDCMVKANVIAKSNGIAACLEYFSKVLCGLGFKVYTRISDGCEFKSGDVIMEIEGNARDLLLIERTLLNTLSYLFGVATCTRRFLDKIRSVNPNVKLAATRKIPPGFRFLVKRAVACGGGDTHRFSLSDAILIKDNHLAILGDVVKAVKLAKSKASFIHKVEIEVNNIVDAIKAVESGADIIMLDNMSVEDASKVIEILKIKGLRDKVIIEVSGGINLENVVDYAKLDINTISTSRITMDPIHVDLSLEIVEII